MKRELPVAPFEASKTKVKALFGIALTGRHEGVNFSTVAPDEKQAEIIWKKIGMGTYDANGLQQVSFFRAICLPKPNGYSAHMSAILSMLHPPAITPRKGRIVREGLNNAPPVYIAIGKPEVRKQEIMDVFVKHPARLICSFIAGAMEFRNVTHVRKLLRELVTDGWLGTQMRERGNGRSLILYFVIEV